MLVGFLLKVHPIFSFSLFLYLYLTFVSTAHLSLSRYPKDESLSSQMSALEGCYLGKHNGKEWDLFSVSFLSSLKAHVLDMAAVGFSKEGVCRR